MTDHSPSLPIETYRDFIAGQSVLDRARGVARDAAIRALSTGRSPDQIGGKNGGWIRFPFYHHVFDDERKGFARQLNYMASLGDFISLDDAADMIESEGSIDGRYFCISFDDGFKNWITNAVPILLDHGVAAAFFVAAGYIGTSVDHDREKLLGFYDSANLLMEFLSWDDCREMAAAGMTIGSHTLNHVHLADLDDARAEAEIKGSKQLIEKELGRACDHFCCPFGREHIDYRPGHHTDMARRAGYRTFLATTRGAVRSGTSLGIPSKVIPRDHMLAGWGNYQLRYFFSR
ncbi:MAG: polysaccharide deacetylase family protein [Proteobacteria bacterium]|nr:polysaccharide deacetylase family protein [Pseudomonadota bacterium]